MWVLTQIFKRMSVQIGHQLHSSRAWGVRSASTARSMQCGSGPVSDGSRSVDPRNPSTSFNISLHSSAFPSLSNPSFIPSQYARCSCPSACLSSARPLCRPCDRCVVNYTPLASFTAPWSQQANLDCESRFPQPPSLSAFVD